MKKGVVLLLTLFFITAISALVLKNLDDTDKFLEKQNYISDNTQVLIAVRNTKNEVSKLLEKYKDSVDQALENEVLQNQIPIKINNLDINFSINKYSKTDINEMQVKDSKVVQNLFLEYDIFDYELFKDIYQDNMQNGIKKVETSKQLDDIINTFIIKKNNDKIIDLRDILGFFKPEEVYELNINVKFNSAIASAYYILKNESTKVEVQYFDISFK